MSGSVCVRVSVIVYMGEKEHKCKVKMRVLPVSMQTHLLGGVRVPMQTCMGDVNEKRACVSLHI